MQFEIDKTKLIETQSLSVNENPEEEKPQNEVYTEDKKTVSESNEDDYVEFSLEFEDEITDEKETESKNNIDIEDIKSEEKDIEEDTSEDTNEDDINLTAFKEFMSKNEKLDELISNYGYDKVFELFDKDNDGKITSEDIKEINSTCESLSDFTYGEIKKYIENNIEENEEDEKDSINEENFDDIVEKLKNVFADEAQNEQTQTPVQQTPAYSSGGGGYSGGGGSYSSGGSGAGGTTSASSSSNTDNTAAKTDEMTLEELEREKQTREGTLQEAQDSLSAVYDETDEEVQNAKDDMDEKEEEYNELLANEAETNPEIKALKEEKDKNDELLKENEENIKTTESDINDKEQEIWEQTDLITNLQSEMSSLEGTLSELQSVEQTEDNKSEIQSKISSVQNQIEQKQSEIDSANDKLEALEEEKSNLEDELNDLNDENKTLKETRDRIEKDISDKASEKTKEALENYQQARDNFETVKNERLEAAQNDVEEAQNDVEEINTQITELKNKELEKENGYNSGAQEFLSELEATGGDAWNDFDKLCSTLGMSREETAEYLTNLCESDEWAAGCIDPVTLCAQIRQESGYVADIVGDSGLAVGLGQFHECAVQEVNNQYGTNYTSADRTDPYKALEMMALLLKYDYSKTGTTEGMLAMYNQGNANGINTTGGQNYVNAVMARINR